MKRLLSLLFLVAFLANCHQEIPTVPVAAFSVQGGNCIAPCEVTFTSNAKNANSYTWDFGDSWTGSGATVKHTYNTAKTYSVKLIVKGDGGSSGSTQTVSILAPPVTASFSIQNNNCTAPCSVTFINNSQYASSFQWNFGNGNAISTSVPSSVSQTYTSAGSYVVTLTAASLDLQSSATQQTVTINAPLATTRQYLNLPFATMVLVPGGTFQMGDSRKEGDNDELPVHSVTLSNFYMGQYEVTQRQWRTVMGNNPSFFSGCDDCPVEQVSWDDVQTFLTKLNQLRPSNTPAFRLPTEAEWEYAAGGGAIANRSRFGNGKDIANPAEINYFGRDYQGRPAYSVVGVSRGKTVTVGSFAPNGLGLYDMSGNVSEWCGYIDYISSAQTNPIGTSQVVRGGGWNDVPQDCRSANRLLIGPSLRDQQLGFRVVSLVQ